MFIQKRKRFGLVLLVIFLFAAIVIPPAAAQINITVTLNANGCSATLNISVADPNILLNGDFGIVFYGGDDAPFAHASISLGNLANISDLDFNYTIVDNDPVPGTVTGRLYAVSGAANSVGAIEAGTLVATVSFSYNDLEACTGITLDDIVDGDTNITVESDEPFPVFFDGRLNDFDSGSPVVLFPVVIEDELGLQVYTPEGELVLNVTPEAIAAIEECPEVNTLILENEDLGISLWRLSSCEFQLMAPTGEPGKWYIIIFDTLYENTFYISFEVFME